jgi:hypothetical protein
MRGILRKLLAAGGLFGFGMAATMAVPGQAALGACGATTSCEDEFAWCGCYPGNPTGYDESCHPTEFYFDCPCGNYSFSCT